MEGQGILARLASLGTNLEIEESPGHLGLWSVEFNLVICQADVTGTLPAHVTHKNKSDAYFSELKNVTI